MSVDSRAPKSLHWKIASSVGGQQGRIVVGGLFGVGVGAREETNGLWPCEARAREDSARNELPFSSSLPFLFPRPG